MLTRPIDYPPMQDPASFNLDAEEADRRGDQEQARRLGEAIETTGGPVGSSAYLVTNPAKER